MNTSKDIDHYAGGFTYDEPHRSNNREDDGEWVFSRIRYAWLIESFIEYMPKRKNSEIMWAVHVKGGKEYDITNKVKKELKNVK